jgi:hypothetical protein
MTRLCIIRPICVSIAGFSWGGADYGCIVTCGATDRAIYESRLAASCRRDSQAPGGEPARRYFVQRLASSLPAPAGEIRHGDVAVKVKLRLVE